MRPLAAPAFLAALLLAGNVAHAAASLVLTDGQVIKGTEIVRRGDAYVVTMKGGNKVSFPTALVKEVQLEADPPPDAPAGFDYSGPKTLAGPKERVSQDARDQLKALGPPAQWSKDVIDTTWTPINAFDPEKDVLAGSRTRWSKTAVDTTWKPTSAYDRGSDVFANSRATWARNLVDTTWTPKDGFGFKPLWPSAVPPVVPPAALPTESGTIPSAPEAPAPPQLASFATPWTCAEALFARNGKPASMTVRTMNNKTSNDLGVPLYEAEGKLRGMPRRAVFTIVENQCRMVGGDADALTGLNLSEEHTMSQDGASFNKVLAARGGPPVPIGVDKMDYALAFVSLTDPAVSGTAAAKLTRIDRPEQLRALVSKPPLVCSLSRGQRRKEERAAATLFVTPKVEPGKDGDVATFLTWSSAEGAIASNRVVISNSGITATRTILASHLGPHKD